MRLRTSNPVFTKLNNLDEGVVEYASIKGVALKTLLLIGVALLSATVGLPIAAFVVSNPLLYIIMLIGIVVVSVIGQTKPETAKICSVIYALLEGLFLGLISFFFETVVSGIILTAIMITATLFSVMLLLFTTNTLRATGRFTKFMMSVGITIAVISLVYFVSYLFNSNNVLALTLASSPLLLLLISGIILIYGALMLILDFENIRAIIEYGFDKRYEWMAALGLMITLIWIYVEALRIVAIFADRNN